MSIMTLLIICSVLVAGGSLVAFLVATKNGHYDDLVTPPLRLIVEDRDDPAPKENIKQQMNSQHNIHTERQYGNNDTR